MSYTVHQAKTHLSRLIKEAEAGKEVIVTRGKKPVAKITAIEQPTKEEVPFRLLGAFRGKIYYDDSIFDPLTDEELHEYGFDDLLEGDLVPPENQ
ncbi:MAG: type II toxin-antitoxin system prevent-host-death family antitoxin [Terracidiphilus sp.]|jgi:prevent-host-death family protein